MTIKTPDIETDWRLDAKQVDVTLEKVRKNVHLMLKRMNSLVRMSNKRMEANYEGTQLKIQKAMLGSMRMQEQSLRKIAGRTKVTYKKMETHVRTSTRKMTRDVQKHATKSVAAARRVGSSWWQSFGRVAIGFTIAYRAMNAFENGLMKIVDLFGDAIRESSELAATQAKMAMWYIMSAKETITYGEAYKRAAVNVRALREAALMTVGTLEEISIGVDEVAQSIGGVPAHLMKGLASLVDFTVMVAATTGSTTRQVRQELQALMTGQIKTTDQLIRSMKKRKVITDKDIAGLKKMTNQIEILEKVIAKVQPLMEASFLARVTSDVTAAMAVWEKFIKFTIIDAINIAGIERGLEGKNIFAVNLWEHAQKFRESVSNPQELARFVQLVNDLDAGFTKLLDLFQNTITGIAKVDAAFHNLAKTLSTVFYAFLLLQSPTALVAGMKAIRWAVMVFLVKPFKVAGAAVTSTYFKMLLIPIAALAIGNAVHTFWKMFSEEPSILAARDQLSWLYQYFAVELPNAFKRLWTSFKNVMSYNWSIIEKFVGYLRSEAAQTAIQAIMMLINPLSGAAVKPAIKGFVDLYDGIVAGINKAKGPLDKLRASFNHLLQMLKHDSQDAAKATSDFWATFSKLYGEGLVDKFKAVQKAIGWEAFKKWFADLADAGEITLPKVNALIKGLGTSVEDASGAMEDSALKKFTSNMASLADQLWIATKALADLKSGIIKEDQFEAYKKYLTALRKAAHMGRERGYQWLREWMAIEKVNAATKAYLKTLKEIGKSNAQKRIDELKKSIPGKEAYIGALGIAGDPNKAKVLADYNMMVKESSKMTAELSWEFYNAYMRGMELDQTIKLMTLDLKDQVSAAKLVDIIIQKTYDLQATGAEKAQDALQKQVLAWRELAAASDDPALKKTLKDLINFYEKIAKEQIVGSKKWFSDLVDFAKTTAQDMQQSMSDLFFDYMRDDLKTAADYWNDFYNNLLRAASNYAAKMAMMGLFGAGIEGSSGVMGSIGSSLWAGLKSIFPFDKGGWLREPVFGIGQSGAGYTFAEHRPEFIGQGGGGETNVVINNYSGSDTQVSEQRNARGGKNILVVIGEAAAGSIQSGGALAKQMKSSYGLTPVVGGR